MIPIILVFTSFLPVSASEVLQSVVQQEFDQSRAGTMGGCSHRCEEQSTAEHWLPGQVT